MRVSNALFAQRAVNGLNERSAALAQVHESISSGRRVNRPSDDPVGAAEAERIRSSKAALEIEQRMMTYATGMLSQAESALGTGGDLLQEARELLIGAGNGAYSAEDRRVISVQLQGVRDQLLAVANQRDGNGGFVFGGQGSTAAPFTTAGDPAYTVNAGTRQTGLTLAFDTTVDGAGVFLGDGGSGLPQTGSIFTALDTIIGQLADPAVTGEALTGALSSAVDATDQSLGRMLTARTEIGEQLRAIEARTRLVESGELRAQSRIGELVDTDYAAAITELQTHQLAMNAAMQTYAQISRLSLFDYL